MDIIKPIQITEPAIVAYNVPQEYDGWDSGTTYAKDDIVRIDPCGSVLYESQVNSNTGIDPTTDDGTNWIRLSAVSNCYAMFDESTGTQTIGDALVDDGDVKIEIDILAGQKLSGFGFLNVSGVDEIYVKILAADGVTIRYEKTKTLRVKNSSGWFDWLFGGWSKVAGFVDFGFPTAISGTKLFVEFRAAGGEVAKVGLFTYGELYNMGKTLHGVSMELKDFSVFTEDDFGNYTITPRRKSNRPSYPIIIAKARFDEVYATLRDELSGKVLLWIPDKDNYPELTVLGFYRNLRVDFPHPAYFESTLQITGTPQ
jgi:hypothetical protein